MYDRRRLQDTERQTGINRCEMFSDDWRRHVRADTDTSRSRPDRRRRRSWHRPCHHNTELCTGCILHPATDTPSSVHINTTIQYTYSTATSGRAFKCALTLNTRESTTSSAIAERPRCSVGQLWPKYQYCFPYSKNIAVDCCRSYAC